MKVKALEPPGCLAILFGFGGSRPAETPPVEPTAGEEGNYHSGPGGYEGGSYAGGYAAEYRSEQGYLDGFEDEEH
jgi:hypothetical protein